MTDNERTIRELNALIETNLDAVLVLKEGLDGLTAPDLRTAVQTMHTEHRDAALRLQERVRALGGEPSTAPHATNKLKEAWQESWTSGDDEKVMLALRANERVAVDGFQLNIGKEGVVQTMSEEGLAEHRTALETELGHFQTMTDLLRGMGAAVDNDEVVGAVRNVAEHMHAVVNLGGTAIEAFLKWATGAKSDNKQHEGFPNRDAHRSDDTGSSGMTSSSGSSGMELGSSSSSMASGSSDYSSSSSMGSTSGFGSMGSTSSHSEGDDYGSGSLGMGGRSADSDTGYDSGESLGMGSGERDDALSGSSGFGMGSPSHGSLGTGGTSFASSGSGGSDFSGSEMDQGSLGFENTGFGGGTSSGADYSETLSTSSRSEGSGQDAGRADYDFGSSGSGGSSDMGSVGMGSSTLDLGGGFGSSGSSDDEYTGTDAGRATYSSADEDEGDGVDLGRRS